MAKTIKLVLDDAAEETLERLRALTGANSPAEVLRAALGTYAALQGILSAGVGELALLDRQAGTVQALTIPTLDRKSVV